MKREFVLNEAKAMVPLVRHALQDLTGTYSTMLWYRRMVKSLDGCQMSADYSRRRQLHQARHELQVAEKRVQEVTEELEDLGVVILDPVTGMVGFPFFWSPNAGSKRVRRAMFLLKLCDAPEKGINSWRFLGESVEHEVPSHWSHEQPTVIVADAVKSKSES
ncbi:MAG: DUF2203 family protein [Planctomycetota bacterium]